MPSRRPRPSAPWGLVLLVATQAVFWLVVIAVNLGSRAPEGFGG